MSKKIPKSITERAALSQILHNQADIMEALRSILFRLPGHAVAEIDLDLAYRVKETREMTEAF